MVRHSGLGIPIPNYLLTNQNEQNGSLPGVGMAKKALKPTGWNRPLASPITLRDGHVIETLGQAAKLMTLRLPKARQEKPIWQKTAAMLMQAHESGKPDDIAAATAQLRRALSAEGWMK
jgi:hypothetical protein